MYLFGSDFIYIKFNHSKVISYKLKQYDQNVFPLT